MTVDSMPAARPVRTEPWTVEDLETLPPDDLNRYEIVDGSLVVTPAPHASHSKIGALLCRLVDRQAPDGTLAAQEVGISIRGGTTYYQADGVVAPRAAFDRRYLDPGDILIVFEVLSPSNRGHDLVQKRHDYAVAGIPQYWIVDPQAETITVLALRDKVFVERAVLKPGDVWHTEEPLKMTIEPAKVFD